MNISEIPDSELREYARWFDGYTGGFLGKDKELDFAVELKREHTLHVCKESLTICSEEGIAGRLEFLAGLSSLFHDIGRFEQFRRYRTFNDKESENHSLLGLKILDEHSVLFRLGERETAMVVQVVENHNMPEFPDNEDTDIMTLTKLVRDADKIDILRIASEYYRNSGNVGGGTIEIGLPDAPEISPEVIDVVKNKRTVRYTSLRTVNDFKLLKLAWAYDLNYRSSRRAVLRRKYMEVIRETLPDDPDVDAVYEQIINYLQNGASCS